MEKRDYLERTLNLLNSSISNLTFVLEGGRR